MTPYLALRRNMIDVVSLGNGDTGGRAAHRRELAHTECDVRRARPLVFLVVPRYAAFSAPLADTFDVVNVSEGDFTSDRSPFVGFL
jgi:hypothetical protein